MSQLKLNVSLNKIKDFNQGKKRPLKLMEHLDQQRKFLRNCGLEYIGRNGVFHEEKALTDGIKTCGTRCTKPGCNIPSQEKIAICTEFWKVHGENYERQSNILLSLIEWSVPKERKVNIDESQRKASYIYFLKRTNGFKIQCCARTFLNTYSVTKRRVGIVQNKLLNGSTYIEDRRGSHENRPNKHSDDTITLIKEHIFSFPTYLSHYKRNEGDPTRQYLESHLSASKLFRLFKQRYGEGVEHLENFYKNTLRETKLLFGPAKSDTCGTCDRLHRRLSNYDRVEVEAIRATETELEIHHMRANEGYDELKSDVAKGKVDPSYVVICIDLQQILLCPRLTHGEMYYKRKMASYNFAITSPSFDSSVMYFWNETDGNRGQNEIGSAIFNHIRTKFQVLQPSQERTLCLWSDRCCGQNNNYSNVCLLKYLMHEGYFSEVNQKFLISGHTFLSCDRHFATIERAQKKEIIHTPEDWIRIIRESRQINPFEVVQLHFQDFLDISSLCTLIPRPPTFKVSSYHWIQLKRSDPASIMTKASHDPAIPWVSHTLYAPFSGRIRFVNRIEWDSFWIADIQVARSYNEELTMSPEKINDIRSMMEYLPLNKQEFYARWLQ